MRRLREYAAVTAAVTALLAGCTSAGSADEVAATGGAPADPPPSQDAPTEPIAAAESPAPPGTASSSEVTDVTPDVRRRVEWRLTASPEAMHSQRGGVEVTLLELTLTNAARMCTGDPQAPPVCAGLDAAARTIVTVHAVVANGTGHLMEVRPEQSTLVLDDRQVAASSFAGSPSPTLVADAVAGRFVWSTDVSVDAFRQRGVVEVRVEAPADPWVGDRGNALTARVEL